jgi:hypothetical protein
MSLQCQVCLFLVLPLATLQVDSSALCIPVWRIRKIISTLTILYSCVRLYMAKFAHLPALGGIRLGAVVQPSQRLFYSDVNRSCRRI